MSVSKFNNEGYYDPVVYEALTKVEAEERAARAAAVRILNKASCRSESELFAKQQAYDKNWSLCNTLAERNRSIQEECEGIIQEYAQLVRGAEGVLNSEGFGNNKLVDDMAEKTAKVILKEMQGRDFSEYGFQDACIKAEMQLQNADKDRSYERGIRIR